MFVIAGASGKTGRVVAETLLSQGKPVRVIVRAPAKAERLKSKGAEVAVASLDDASALARALDGATAFYTLVPEDPAAADIHLHARRMVDAVAAAVRESRIPHVVLLSACTAVIADGSGPWKRVRYAEEALRDVAPTLTTLRPSSFHENVLAAVEPARHQGIYPNFFPDTELAFPSTATSDVGRLAARVMVEQASRSEVIDVIGPAYSVNDMATALGHVLGKTLRVVDVPPEAHVATLMQTGMSRSYAEALAEMFARFAPARVTPQGDRVEHATTTLDEALRDALGG